VVGPLHDLSFVAGWNLVEDYYQDRQFDKCDKLAGSLADITEKVLGLSHWTTVQACGRAAMNAWAVSNHVAARAAARKAAQGFESLRIQVSTTGLDRASIHAGSPFRLLAALDANAGEASDAWKHFESDLGRGLLDELLRRRLVPLEEQEQVREQKLQETLHAIEKGITAILDAEKAPAEVGRQFERLQAQRNRAEGELVALRQRATARHGIRGGESYDLARIRKSIPPDSAMIAWLELAAPRLDSPATAEVWALVLRAAGEPRCVRLRGSDESGAWTAEDLLLPLEIYRGFLLDSQDGQAATEERLAVLRRQRFQPLAECLTQMAGDTPVRRLIVLPSGLMSWLPVELLAPAYTVSYAPSGTIYAWLREKRSAHDSASSRRSASLLALGNPVLTRPAWMQGEPKLLAPELPGTELEVQSIAAGFSDKTVLLGSKASQQSLERLVADGSLPRFTHLHLATHTQFDRSDPWRSSLLLSTDQLPDPIEQIHRGSPVYSGRLTSTEILRTWKLNAELVVLSACSSAMGEYRGGDGFLGFSQVLFLAGARSAVLSLWPSHDGATSFLMTRFYQNLLGSRPGVRAGMPKAEALAEAKAWLRDASADDLRTTLELAAAQSPERRDATADALLASEARRALATADAPQTSPTTANPSDREPGLGRSNKPFAHPRYWAGFVLIGDPD